LLFRGPLWENRWDNFLFLFPSQFLRSILRHFIPQFVPLIIFLYTGMLWHKIVECFSDIIIMIFNLVQLYVSPWVLKTKSFFPPFSLSNQFPFWPDYWVVEYFCGFLDILGYTNNNSIVQDGVLLIYLLGINGFLSYISFGFSLRYSLFTFMICLFIPSIGNLEAFGIVAQILVFNIVAAYYQLYNTIRRPVRH
jgi:hypothetical protein